MKINGIAYKGSSELSRRSEYDDIQKMERSHLAGVGRGSAPGFGYFVVRAVREPPTKDFKPGSAVIHLMLSTDVSGRDAENWQEGDKSEGIPIWRLL